MHLHRDSTDSDASAGSFDFHGVEHEIDYFDEPDDESSSNLSTKLGREISKDAVAVLISKYGNSSATAWLEFERYHLWQADEGQVPESSFPPVQGYMARKKWVFAWGNPLVSDKAALPSTARAFTAWVRSQNLTPVWCCIDAPLEHAMGELGWSTVDCIYEDVLHAKHVLQMTSNENKGKEGQHVVKDLKKNLRRAEKAGLTIQEVTGKWTDKMRDDVNSGIERWKKHRVGPQIASTTFVAFTDEPHRRYWLAFHNNNIVGILILTPTGPSSYLIKNCASFPDAPRGTSEALIHRGLEVIDKEGTARGCEIPVSFGITASDGVKPVSNLSGWKIMSLSKVYHSVSMGAGLFKRADFRSKFDSEHQPMYVAYTDGFGVDTIRSLLKVLKK
ncbi:hypothetical protein CYLTODRAFT_423595 [Cylindrobasidium torrendii FP15055 ss-10]|uniref:Phosphatidylglycerol lysyltransferase C-terminal domain-containing protein n=1 Tax=Cylindrobasidium torrendii FP15055 ss-10 TaxID=1314674 RepID=A0A0D7B9S0_9AGAR|nr:hypothetical protein CYLTODRAFT_423595 [Cylindrobasidium torrendii FP15055 ss-10]